MNHEYAIPPLRELPPARLARRSAHLRAEIAREQPSSRLLTPRRSLVLAALVLALGAVLVATPAFGLRDQLVRLLTAEKHERPPAVILRYFTNLNQAPANIAPGVIPAKARIAMAVSIPHYGHKVLWVAPTRAGGFCSWPPGGCDRDRSIPFSDTLEVAGPTSRNSSPAPGSGDVHVFFVGDTIVRGAAAVAIRFEDGSSTHTQLVWVSKPIDAGFFVYVLPKAHWKVGKRPVALVVEDARGHELARSTRAAGYFRDTQSMGLAPPSAAESHTNPLWFVIPAAAAAVAAAALLAWWRRRRIGALLEDARDRVRQRPLVYAAAVLLPLAIAGVVLGAIALAGGFGSGSKQFQLDLVQTRGNVVSHHYASGYVREGFLGTRSRRDRVLIARTPDEGLRWDRWITHHRVSPPQAADFAHQALIGVFLLGHPSPRTQGVAVTSLTFRDGTLRLSYEVSPHPIDFCGPGPDSPTECSAMYRAHSARYHAFTIISIHRSVAARVHRIVVTRDGYHPGEILVGAPAAALP
jgi:hypothetical protein